jgi:PAS domain S-box-containing protein
MDKKELLVPDQELNRYWKTVVDTIQDGVMIVDVGGTIISANQALERITGYSRQELIGKPCSILNCNICEVVFERNSRHWCMLFKTGSLKKRKCTLTRKDSSLIHILKNASILQDNQGQVIGAVETMTDISELMEKDTQLEAIRRQLRSEDGFQGIIGTSPVMNRVFDMIVNVAGSDAPVLILGESGTGKELAARAIHMNSARKDKPYIKVNCAALNESLLESELFGHVKGAFTGAYQNREGRFEAASRGSIFLDEIGDLPISIQIKLLRVLEDRVIERVGDNHPISVDVRVITATNRNLKQLVEKGSFRSDFYYRINVIPLALPTLRERYEDIPLLAEYFFERVQLKSNKPIRGISPEAMQFLVQYHWPGNVRELKSAFEYAFAACQEAMIYPPHLPPDIQFRDEIPRSSLLETLNPAERKKKELIEALAQTNGNQSLAGRILGISRVTVWNRMQRYGLTTRHGKGTG